MNPKYSFDEVTHTHRFGDKPLMGTTTLIKEMMPPPLAWWSSGKALEMLGWTNPNYQNENYVPRTEGIKIASDKWLDLQKITLEEYYDLLQQCYRNHDVFKKEAGDWGTQKHELIEIAIKEAIANNKGYLKNEPYEDEAVERFAQWGRGKKFLYSEVYCYSESLWLGGIMDNVYEENGKYYIGDVKTSRSGVHASAFMQLGLYDSQQAENGFYTANGDKVGEPLPIAGYTIVPIPKEPKRKNFVPMTCEWTDKLKDFGKMLAEGYKLKKKLEEIIKK